MADKPRKFFTTGRIVLALSALFSLDILGGILIPKLNDMRTYATFEDVQCNVSDEELSKVELKKTRVCKSDSDCALVPGQCGPSAINRDYICVEKAEHDRRKQGRILQQPQSPPKIGAITFTTMSCNIMPGPWKSGLPHTLPALKILLSEPVCVQSTCQLK